MLKKYYTQSDEQDDLISIGTIGLIKGVSTYRPEKGTRLATLCRPMRGECYTNVAEQSAVEVENHEPFGAKWSMFCRLKVRSYVLAANVAGTLKVAPLQILKFPVVLPHKFLDAEKFNLRFSDASEITEIADKLRWYRYQKDFVSVTRRIMRASTAVPTSITKSRAGLLSEGAYGEAGGAV